MQNILKHNNKTFYLSNFLISGKLNHSILLYDRQSANAHTRTNTQDGPFLVVVVVIVLTTLLVVRVLVVIFFMMASSVSCTSTCSPALHTFTVSFVFMRFSMLVRMAVPVFSSVESITLMSLFSSSFDSFEITWSLGGCGGGVDVELALLSVAFVDEVESVLLLARPIDK